MVRNRGFGGFGGFGGWCEDGEQQVRCALHGVTRSSLVVLVGLWTDRQTPSLVRLTDEFLRLCLMKSHPVHYGFDTAE